MNFYTLSATYLIGLIILAQAVPENLKNWPIPCQRLHFEVNKCENGLKSCDQHKIDHYRKLCERAEPKPNKD